MTYRTKLMKRHNKATGTIALAAACVFVTGQAFAGQLSYTPDNPNFGGSPLNGDFLLGSAQLQNQHSDPNPPADNAPEINLPPINIDVDTGGAGGGGGGQPPIIILPVGGGI